MQLFCHHLPLGIYLRNYSYPAYDIHFAILIDTPKQKFAYIKQFHRQRINIRTMIYEDDRSCATILFQHIARSAPKFLLTEGIRGRSLS